MTVATEYDTKQVFDRMPDDLLIKLIRLLRLIASGRTEFTKGPFAKMSFPQGFDPINHPHENIELAEKEAVRRGVTVTSHR